MRELFKVCSNSPGHMTKMAAMPFKIHSNPLLQNQKADDLGPDM